MANTYQKKLKDPRWQKKRYEIFTRDNWTCRGCRNTNVELHVHHKVYYPNRDPWDYSSDDLMTYCKLCHNWEHGIVPFKDNSDYHKEENTFIKTRNKLPNLDEIKDHLIKRNKNGS